MLAVGHRVSREAFWIGLRIKFKRTKVTWMVVDISDDRKFITVARDRGDAVLERTYCARTLIIMQGGSPPPA